MKDATWENWINVVLGIWLMLAPWLLPVHLESARLSVMISHSLAGAVLFASAALALQELTSGEEWVALVAGTWVFLSPWILGYTADTVPFWNALVTGLVVAVASALALPVARDRERREQG